MTEFKVSITVEHIETATKLSTTKTVEADSWEQAAIVAIEESKILKSGLPHD